MNTDTYTATAILDTDTERGLKITDNDGYYPPEYSDPHPAPWGTDEDTYCAEFDAELEKMGYIRFTPWDMVGGFPTAGVRVYA